MFISKQIAKHNNSDSDRRKPEQDSDESIISKIGKISIRSQNQQSSVPVFQLDEREFLKDFDEKFSSDGMLIDDLNLSDFGLNISSENRITKALSSSGVPEDSPALNEDQKIMNFSKKGSINKLETLAEERTKRKSSKIHQLKLQVGKKLKKS